MFAADAWSPLGHLFHSSINFWVDTCIITEKGNKREERKEAKERKE